MFTGKGKPDSNRSRARKVGLGYCVMAVVSWVLAVYVGIESSNWFVLLIPAAVTLAAAGYIYVNERDHRDAPR
ncbi:MULTISPECIES: hypothetical protein [unclassified Arthrobacter]|uniref:hypothetical protein n=1 Tax=unclassified Arthrobacter TaxID=235627 RepID=UPI0012FA0366|nr:MULTISPECIES: hypothetical protein [unclassified Arthrobacter]